MIELNADIGEGGVDALLVPYVSRVSIACGGHVGDAVSMHEALLLAKRFGAMPGAHPSYPDAANFGRVDIPATPRQIAGWVEEQTYALMHEADKLGMCLFHVKPHGAMYNRAAVDQEVAEGVIDAVKALGLKLVVLAGSPLVGWAREAGIVVLEEAFADRAYLSGGQLAPRSRTGALLEMPQEAVAQALAIASGRPIATLDGGCLLIRADTLCLHGDAPGAVGRARAVAHALGLNPENGS